MIQGGGLNSHHQKHALNFSTIPELKSIQERTHTLSNLLHPPPTTTEKAPLTKNLIYPSFLYHLNPYHGKGHKTNPIPIPNPNELNHQTPPKTRNHKRLCEETLTQKEIVASRRFNRSIETNWPNQPTRREKRQAL
ncbi:T32E20.27 [Arabidopsis thaliana]|uniref:T32E20.27 n=1 Tax=Arabidopsis thaliana TaxID=3702 RepID=Q9LP93_ARATH|nr:T32E20.27 [Arabidopsis thaliana]